MAKLELNYDALRNSCIENVNSSIKKLNNAVSILNNLNIPYDFGYKNSIYEIIKNITSDKDQLVTIKNWVINSNNDFTKTANEFCGTVTKLPISKYGKRG